MGEFEQKNNYISVVWIEFSIPLPIFFSSVDYGTTIERDVNILSNDIILKG